MSLYLKVSLLLSDWITSLLAAVPPRSRATFAELLCGCLLSKEGWVTGAIGSIQTGMHWTTFYKMLQRGSIKTQKLAVALFHLIQRQCAERVLTFVVDDTMVPRQSKSAPGAKKQFDHSNKPNRPSFMQAQVWVTIGVSVVDAVGRACVLPVRSRLVPETGNRSRLRIAEALVRALLPHVRVPVRLLFDAWFMRKNFVFPLVKRNVRFIGRSRHDTALFLPPPPRAKGKRGAGRKYGDRITPEFRAALPVMETRLFIYGREQKVRIQSANAVARFLCGMRVTAVWCQIFDETKKEWSATKLILSNETGLDAQEIVRLFSRRWGIEPLFHNLKRWWGCKDLWQQSEKVLELWMQMRSAAYVLTQLLAIQLQQSFPMSEVAPWRIGRPVTAGLFLAWLRREFSGLRFRAGFCVKSQKFQWPFSP